MLVREMYTEEEMLEKLKNLKPGQILFHKGYKPTPKVQKKASKRLRLRYPPGDKETEIERRKTRAAWREIFAEKTPEERARLAEYAALIRGQ